MATIVSEIAQREWPQRWENLVDLLLKLASVSDSHRQLCVLVLRNLAEIVTAYCPALPDLRRREIQQGLTSLLASHILPFCAQLLGAHAPRYLNSAHQQAPVSAAACAEDLDLCLSCLSLVEAFSEYSGIPVLVTSHMLQNLAGLLRAPVFAVPVLRIYMQALNRKSASVDGQFHPVVLSLWHATLELARAVLQANPPNPLYLLDSLESAMAVYLRNHSALLTPDDDASVHAVCAGHLGVLASFAGHSLPSVSACGLDAWVRVLRDHQHLLKASLRAGLVQRLFSLCLLKGSKSDLGSAEVDFGSSSLSAAVPSSGGVAGGDDESPDANQTHGRFRALGCALVGVLANLCPELTLTAARDSLAELLVPASDHLNAQGYSTVQSSQYRQLDSWVVLVEAVTKVLDLPKLLAGVPTEPSVVLAVLGDMLARLLHFNPHDPLLQCRRLAGLAVFSAYYVATPSSLPRVLEALFAAAQHRTPEEAQAPVHELSLDLKSTRKRAIYSLLLLARQVPTLLLGVFDAVLQRTLALASQGLIAADEKILLYGTLATISNAIDDKNRQSQFLDTILRDPLQRWISQDVSSLLVSPHQLLAMLLRDIKGSPLPLAGFGAVAAAHPTPTPSWEGSDPQAPHVQLYHIVTAFHSVFEAVTSRKKLLPHQVRRLQLQLLRGAREIRDAHAPPNGSVPHPLTQALLHAVPNVLALLTSLHAFYRPSLARSLPAEAVPMLCASRRLFALTYGEAATESAQNRQRTWVTNMLTMCAQLVALAAQCLPDALHRGEVEHARDDSGVFVHIDTLPPLFPNPFYLAIDPGVLVTALLGDIEHVPSPHVRVLLDKCLPQVCFYLPPSLYSRFVPPLLQGITGGLWPRIVREWTCTLRSRHDEKGGVNMQSEIEAERETMELTWAYLDFLHHAFAFSDGMVDRRPQTKKAPNPNSGSAPEAAPAFQRSILEVNNQRPGNSPGSGPQPGGAETGEACERLQTLASLFAQFVVLTIRGRIDRQL
jgi:hypothetical protein